MLQATLDFAATPEPILRSISPLRELGAHEALWLRPEMTSRRLAELFRRDPEALPSDLVDPAEAAAASEIARERLRARGVHRFGVRIRRSNDYPSRLADAADPAPLLYFQGLWELVDTRIVAVVGTRSPSPAGARAAEAIARGLAAEGFTIASGLASGIDTAAHRAALAAGGRTIAVVGTPLGGRLSPRRRRPPGADRPRSPPGLAGAGRALRPAGLATEPPLLPGPQRDDVGAERG